MARLIMNMLDGVLRLRVLQEHIHERETDGNLEVQSLWFSYISFWAWESLVRVRGMWPEGECDNCL